MAFAGPASATEQIQVVNETTGTICSSISSPHTTVGCALHASGTVELETILFGVEAHEPLCDIELEMRVSGAGVAAVDDLDLYGTEIGSDSSCTAAPPTVEGCDYPWEGSGEGDGATGVVRSNFAVCLDPAEAGTCVGNLSFSMVEGGGEITTMPITNSRIGTSVCEINGTLGIEWEISGNVQLHITTRSRRLALCASREEPVRVPPGYRLGAVP